MSYRFEVSAPSKETAKQQVGQEIERVVKGQRVHALDRNQALAAAESLVDLLPQPEETETLFVSMSGSVGWHGDTDAPRLRAVTLSISAAVIAKQPA